MDFDIYQAVTDRIIEALQNGIIPWQKPWTGTANGAISHTSGKPYSLINQFLLREPGEYITFSECEREGGKVKKGSKARMVVFWKMVRKQVKGKDGSAVINPDGTPKAETIPVLRYFNVFNINDCEGIEPKWTGDSAPKTADTVDDAEAIITDYASRAKLSIMRVVQNEAYYSPMQHMVMLPAIEQFQSSAEYYSTAFHELTHSTGHRSLLDRFPREEILAAFGSESYSKEELVAEIGACSILNRLGMETESSFRNSAAYVQSWLKALKNDNRMIVSAASRAEKAVNLILGIGGKDDE